MQVEIKQSLSLWEKFKAGVKGMAKTVMQYVPRGVLTAAVVFTAAGLIGSATGWDPLLISKAYSEGWLAQRFGAAIMLGAGISGALGAVQGVVDAGNKRNDEIALQAAQLAEYRAQTPERQREAEFAVVAPQSELPYLANKVQGKIQANGLV